ncbi:hypothetical protein B296_00038237 [Ensete ventricosum]|uniref:Uncharacterized protein n=1 Tax=Ensete ventricosum TaxID=4639 RepID=A0A426ZV30_ENSVE|nr:hypothetical protein B296_00038237 [Ensete ventricosum]
MNDAIQARNLYFLTRSLGGELHRRGGINHNSRSMPLLQGLAPPGSRPIIPPSNALRFPNPQQPRLSVVAVIYRRATVNLYPDLYPSFKLGDASSRCSTVVMQTKDSRKADLYPHFKQRYKHSDLLQQIASLDTRRAVGSLLEETLSTAILILPSAFL